ncbi:hypothetical protein HPB49_020550 [Dermacentor silvarum]|uniref:Uncharacterized protein n=1 Tax=Dermacentor silvarum TaxID=543639 RepID=A0ACB8CSR5_DERSI|nr:uncharacterized protein LOC125945304 [Dermacentor silvarum]KAH7950181.1 hypothetical protein HPB49_020550 [Dermacentor silvarum]
MRPTTGLLLFLVAQLFQGSEQSTWFDYVPLVDGNCVVEGQTIPLHQSISLSGPCEVWSCSPENATHGLVSANGCSVTKVYGDAACTMKPREGAYPKCCPTVDCGNAGVAVVG